MTIDLIDKEKIYVFYFYYFKILKSILYFKVTLFDSTKVKNDLNWSKISFKEVPLSSDSASNSNNWLTDKLNGINNNNEIYGVKIIEKINLSLEEKIFL